MYNWCVLRTIIDLFNLGTLFLINSKVRTIKLPPGIVCVRLSRVNCTYRLQEIVSDNEIKIASW